MQNNRYNYAAVAARRAPYTGRVRRRVLPRFYFFCAVFLALIVWGITAILPDTTAVVRYGSIGTTERAQALIVRNESVSSAKGWPSQIVPLMQEGAQVSVGDAVVEIYTSSYNDKIRQELHDVRTRIREAQEGDLLRQLNSQSLKQLDTRIDETVENLINLARGYTNSGLIKTQNEMSALLKDRQDLLRRVAVADRDLEQLYEQETNLTARIAGWKSDITSEHAGIVSYHFTGLEEVVRPQTVDQLTVSNVRTLLKGEKPPASTVSKTERALYRVVAPGSVQLVVVLPRDKVPMAVDQNVALRFVGYESLAETARVVRLTTDGSSQLAVLSVNVDVLPLLNLTSIQVDVGGSETGLIVPVDGLSPAPNGGFTVETVQGEQIPVEVLGQDRYRALVKPVTQGALSEGLTIKLR